MQSTFSKLMTSGTRHQLAVMGEEIEHVSVGGESQSDLLALPRNFAEVDRDVSGDIVRVHSGIFTIRRQDLRSLVTRLSKFVWNGLTYNVDETDDLMKSTVYMDVSVYLPIDVRKGPDGLRRDLM